MNETADWIVAYQEAFRAANPEHKEPIRVQLWTAGWYRIAMPGRDFDSRKYRRSQIEAFTARLVEKIGKAEATPQENAG